MSIPLLFAKRRFSPRNLFAAGEQGVWYDPSDFSTMFQDSAGTTPVTAIEQPVGLLLDKSKNLVIGAETITNPGGPFVNTTGYTTIGTVTLSVVSGALSIVSTGAAGAIWTLSGLTVGATYKVTVTARTAAGVSFDARASSNDLMTIISTSAPITSLTNTTISFYFRATETNNKLYLRNSASATTFVASVSATQIAGNHASQPTTTSRPILRNRYNQLVQTATLSTQNVTTRGTSHKLSFSGAGTITLSGTATGTFSAGTNTFTATAGTLTLTVSGTVTEAMLTEANDGNVPYQWVTTGAQSTSNPVSTVTAGYDTDVTKFPPFLFFDGSDDWLQTGNIDFSATNNVSEFAGVRKLSDANATIAELSADINANNGSFLLWNYNDFSDFAWRTKGTVAVDTYANLTTPITAVLTGFGNIGGDFAQIRANAVVAQTVTTDQGTGNYGNYPLYIGARYGTTTRSLFFFGRIYSLIIRGALTSSPQLEQVERWVAAKTGVSL